VAVDYKKEGQVAIFTINRPEVANAMNVQAYKELSAAVLDFRDDDNLLVGIITGAGDRAFCAGVDLKDFMPVLRKSVRKPWQIPPTFVRRVDLYKPMIAAVNGVALGYGCEMSLACDIRLASENAKFGLPEATLSVFPGGGSTQRLPRLIPPGIAAEMLFTGKRIDAQEAYRVGLVNSVLPVGQVLKAAKELADRICQSGPLAVRSVKQSMIRGVYNMPLDEGLILEEMLQKDVFESKDMLEGVNAFFEKRKPNFKGE
jgi:enoyl-CoA hydratase/carnithine racemase